MHKHLQQLFVPQDTWSVTSSRVILLFMVAVLGIQAPLVTVAQFWGFTFHTYVIISMLLSIACVSFVLRKNTRVGRLIIRDYGALLGLLGLSFLGMILALSTNRPDTDDYYYTANAVYFLDHPDEPMDFELHFLQGPDAEPIISVSQGVSMPYDYFRAIPAYWSDLHYLDMYYILSVAAMGFLIPIAHFFLISRLVKQSSSALLGTVVIVAILLTLTESHRTYGNFAFPRIYQGKAVALSIGIPVFTAFSFSYFLKPSKENWIALCLTIMAVVSMSASSILLFLLLAILLAISYAATSGMRFLHTRQMRVLILSFGTYLLSTWYAFFYGFFLIFQSITGNNSGNSFEVGGSSTFLRHLQLLYNPSLPLTAFVVLYTFICLLLLLKGRQRFFFLSWWLALVILLFNPISAALLINTLIPKNIYWRLFYLGPFPLAAGVVAATAVQRTKMSAEFKVGIAVVILSVSGAYYLHHFSELGQLHFPPDYKLPTNDLACAKAVSDIAPPGVMLAPPSIYGIIPMLTADNPQVLTRDDGNRFWLTDEQPMLEGASFYVGGDPAYREDFINLLERDRAEVIVIDESSETSIITGLMQEYGFSRVEEIAHCYTIYTKS